MHNKETLGYDHLGWMGVPGICDLHMCKCLAGAACRAVNEDGLEEALHPAVEVVLPHGVVVAGECDELLLTPVLVVQLLRVVDANEGVFLSMPCTRSDGSQQSGPALFAP